MSSAPQLTIDTLGCRITNLTLKGQPLLWAGTRPDGKLASTHPCLPNFSQITQGPLKDLPQHGLARNSQWQAQTNGRYVYTWSMPKFRDLYPAGLHVTRRFTLTNASLTLTQTHTNHGEQVLPINPAEHLYFHCDALKRGQLQLNHQLIPASHWGGTGTPWPMAAPTSNGISRNTIVLPISTGGSLNLTLSASGYTQFRLWSLPDAPFVCIEPTMGQPNEIYLDQHRLFPQQTTVFTLKLQL